MKGMAFKKALSLSGIFLLSIFMFVQLGWACDDDDKGDCDHHGKACHPPKIQRVFLDYQADSIVFEIWGKNFEREAPLVVTLGGIYALTVDESLTNDNVITATLSSIAEKNFKFGDYTLIVATGHDCAGKDKYCQDHGPNCRCKYCRDHRLKGKDKYCRDDEFKCRCKDRYSLTISGPPGPPSPITLTRVSVSETLPIPPEGDTVPFDRSAVCEGGVVTGGGFSCPKCGLPLLIRVNEPLQDLSGWHIGGAAYVEFSDTILTIYAICAQGQ